MPPCNHCGHEVPAAARYCPHCGATQSSVSQLPTEAAHTGPATPSLPIGRLDSSSSGASGFAPGQVLADRYRVIGLLGRGGMGEVYRADDLRLGQPVSLKFLPRKFGQNPALIELFHAEVRNARQVSHPNVCRVYDIGEIDGQHFLSMEYVDGEDLATLLRRIGRLPAAKANEVARQLCAGIAAAHDKGVLHRDLKPSNIMIDGNGRVRITDFGLAARVGESKPGDSAGTPAYMAPEQFAGGPITAKSDLYSLGLVLYETYTGKRPFEATSQAEWKSHHTSTPPAPPSEREAQIDDAVERVILRCLEKDPSRRPASALQVAAALPGGDPLAAALAAGETPSPQMVAASGGEGATSPRTAWGLLLGTLAVIAAIVAVSPYSTDLGLTRIERGGQVLTQRAREILTRFGYGERVDSESWFGRDYFPMRHLALTRPSTEWRREMKSWPAPVDFLYRQSPRWLIPLAPSRVSPADPPYEVSGMSLIRLDSNGALRLLRAVPPQLDSTDAGAASVDWSALFAEAALDPARFVAVAPRWVPPAGHTARAEWVGAAPWDSTIALRVAAAAYGSRPVYFEVLGPWSLPLRQQKAPVSLARQVATNTLILLIVVASGFGIYFMRRNVKMGRSDQRGAWRLAWLVFGVTMVRWIVGAHHTQDVPGELTAALQAAGEGLGAAVVSAVIYLSLEPFIRRRMPELMIGWARLIEGRFADPRVGRDVLVGTLLGSLLALVLHVSNALPTWIPIRGQTTLFPSYETVQGGRHLVDWLVHRPFEALGPALGTFSMMFLLRTLIPRPAWAWGTMFLLATLVGLGGENFALETPGAILNGAIITLAAAGFGLLALMTMAMVTQTLTQIPLPLDFATPYVASNVIVLGLLLAMVVFAFRASLGGRPLVDATIPPS